jgi:hypothetical protein
MDKLRAVATRTLAAAGPRYSPALDPGAPNLEIQSLQRASSALSLGAAFSARVKDLAGGLRSAYDRDHLVGNRPFEGRRVNLQRVIADLDHLADGRAPSDARRRLLELRRHLNVVRGRLEAVERETYAALRELAADNSDPDSEESKRTRSQERDRLQMRISALRRLDDPLGEISEFADGSEGQLLTQRSSILLLGAWGTGKTHFLCDFALQALSDECPAVVVLASELRTDVEPLDAIADTTGLAASGTDLLHLLDSAGAARGRRALLLIDAVNESDRESWRRWLPQLVRAVRRVDHLGLIVSCRTPFHESVVTTTARNSMVELHHPGFQDQEFDAQIEFFGYYGLPALHVPLLTAEFSRPLFLRLLCEGIRNLSKRSQKSKLREIASGQKSMTYVLEHFVKRVGAEVEAAHKLPPRACWLVMKGEPRKGRQGLAGVLASSRREWLLTDEAVQEVRAFAAVDEDAARSIIASMRAAGLLIEHSRFDDGRYVDVLMLPYQRFSDHLIARHLLDEHLDVSSETKLRRCFYSNQRLGAVFIPDRWGRQFAEPGVASALMIEFPERVKRLVAAGGARAELLAYLPRKRQLLHPFVDAFLEGLYWRDASGLSADTERLLVVLLERHNAELRARTYEVLFGLAARADDAFGVDLVRKRLIGMTMPERDVQWSEFVRTADRESNVHRLLAWVERENHAKVDEGVAHRSAWLVALLLTATDRVLRDRATRALVLIGEGHPRALFDLVPQFLSFSDPYVAERILAASYGVCMRRWAREAPRSPFADSVHKLAQCVLELVLRPGAPHATWHALTRGYAIGVLQILLQLRPRALSRPDRELLAFAPGQAPSPFRPVSRIRKRDVDDAEHAIHMDFGNYTIGSLVDGRGNYDFKHREYTGVRRQIADRMRRLGYSADRFNELDRRIVQQMEYRRDGHKVDRYGKKYSWIAYFEMYGLRSAMGRLDDHPLSDPRTTDCDIDPSFPTAIPEWDPPRPNVFGTSPVEIHDWIVNGATPDYVSLLRLTDVDGNVGDWVLLNAAIHEGVEDGRELRGWVTSVLAPERSIARLRAEAEAGRDLSDNGFPDLAADYYTYHGEVPWSLAYGSDVRTTTGRPKRVSDRAFDYFLKRWRSGIAVEPTCRQWAWESYHSELNQVGSVVFPAPPLAVALKLRVVGGSTDMVDQREQTATVYREAPGPGFGSHYLYMRRDLLQSYARDRGLRLVQAVVGERSVSYRMGERGLPDSARQLFQAGAHRFGAVVGLDSK